MSFLGVVVAAVLAVWGATVVWTAALLAAAAPLHQRRQRRRGAPGVPGRGAPPTVG